MDDAYLIGLHDKETFQPVEAAVWSQPPWMASRNLMEYHELVILSAAAPRDTAPTMRFSVARKSLFHWMAMTRRDLTPWIEVLDAETRAEFEAVRREVRKGRGDG